MTEQVLEIAYIHLAADSTEADLLAASDSFQQYFLSQQDGLIRRDMARKRDGIYVDVIVWQSRAHADAVFERAQSSEIAGQYFGHMQFDPENLEEGIEHHTLLKSFAKDA